MNNNNNMTTTTVENEVTSPQMLRLHKDQQSLILGEMMNARHRLEEENSELRDKLIEAELVIKLLSLQLSKTRRIMKEELLTDYNNENHNLTMTQNNNNWKRHPIQYTKQKILKSRRNKASFRNTKIPGKKTFDVASPPSLTAKNMSASTNSQNSVPEGNDDNDDANHKNNISEQCPSEQCMSNAETLVMGNRQKNPNSHGGRVLTQSNSHNNIPLKILNKNRSVSPKISKKFGNIIKKLILEKE